MIDHSPAHPCHAGGSAPKSVALRMPGAYMNDINRLGVTHRGDTGSSAGVENGLSPGEHPKWARAELRPLMTATNPVSWSKASSGSFAVHERGFRWARRRERSAFPGLDCARAREKVDKTDGTDVAEEHFGSRPGNGSASKTRRGSATFRRTGSWWSSRWRLLNARNGHAPSSKFSSYAPACSPYKRATVTGPPAVAEETSRRPLYKGGRAGCEAGRSVVSSHPNTSVA